MKNARARKKKSSGKKDGGGGAGVRGIGDAPPSSRAVFIRCARTHREPQGARDGGILLAPYSNRESLPNFSYLHLTF